jgi:hypothetical protein
MRTTLHLSPGKLIRHYGYTAAEWAIHSGLPYGVWTLHDGGQVLFNRDYEPLWCRRDGRVWPADRAAWIRGIARQMWLYTNNTPLCDRRRLGLALLRAWGVQE